MESKKKNQEINIKLHSIDKVLVINHHFKNHILINSGKVYPKTISEGQFYNSKFSQIHLDRNLSFSKEKNDNNIIFVTTLRRSGTHLLARALEDITGEWVTLFPQSRESYSLENFDELSHEECEYTRIFLSHGVGHDLALEKHIFKRVLLVRDPLDSIDSLYHKRSTEERMHGFKLEGQYWTSPDYEEEALLQAKKMNTFYKSRLIEIEHLDFTYFVVKYEDIILNAHNTLVTLLTYIKGYPAEAAWGKKVDESLGKKGISSFYKTIPYSSKNSDNPLVYKALKFLPRKLIKNLMDHLNQYVFWFEYEAKYQGFLSQEFVIPKERYSHNNMKALKRALKQ